MNNIAIYSDLLWLSKQAVDIEVVKRRFTYIPKFDNLRPVIAYKEDGDRIGIPRNAPFDYFDLLDNTYSGPTLNISFRGTLREHQADIFNRYLKKKASGVNDIVLRADTGCLSKDTKVRINRNNKIYEIPIEKLYRRFNCLDINPAHNYDDNFTYVKSFDGKFIKSQRVEGVIYSGVKSVYKLELINGESIKATFDHKIFTDEGWVQLGDIIPGKHKIACDALIAQKHIGVKSDLLHKKHAEIYFEYPNLNQGNIIYIGVKSIEYIGDEDTYDIQCPDHHNFVANNMVVHNSGKTVILLYIWAALGIPALVIVPKVDLMEQWRERIIEFTDTEPSEIGEARQNVCNYRGKKIVIGMLHSLCKNKYGTDFNNYFGLIMFDEMHRLGAHNFSTVGGMFPAKYRLGATATMRRSDGMSEVFYDHLGREVIEQQGTTIPDIRVATFKYTKSSGNIPNWARSKVQRRGKLFSLLDSNSDRTEVIAYFSDLVVNSERQTLVISERLNQLKEIRRLLIEKYRHRPDKVGLYIGSTKKAERKRVVEQCSCILATKNMLSEGTDIPTLRGLVFATPMADVEQTVGRISRQYPGLKKPFILDIVDIAYPETRAWFSNRISFYRKHRFKIDEVWR